MSSASACATRAQLKASLKQHQQSMHRSAVAPLAAAAAANVHQQDWSTEEEEADEQGVDDSFASDTSPSHAHPASSSKKRKHSSSTAAAAAASSNSSAFAPQDNSTTNPKKKQKVKDTKNSKSTADRYNVDAPVEIGSFLRERANHARRIDLILSNKINMNKLVLQYKMTRDGAKPADFYKRCCEQGPLLMVVKTSYTTFGMYIGVSLPRHNKAALTTVPDPEGRSFIFLLDSRPFRLKLTNYGKLHAFAMERDGTFTAGVERTTRAHFNHASLPYDLTQSQFPSVKLFDHRRAATILGSFSIGTHFDMVHERREKSYEVDESSFSAANPKPAGFACGACIFTGDDEFVRPKEIEVYRFQV